MQIYTGNSYGQKFDRVKKYNLGIMISSSPTFKPDKGFAQVPCALDNGAFVAYKKGYPFPEAVFLKTLDNCYSLNLKLDFIVCPDIIAGGMDSLDYSLEWAMGRLKTAPRLALVVQDGIVEKYLDHSVLQRFSHIFVGGTVAWKWKTVRKWVWFAHQHNKKCHVGQVGQLARMELCEEIGVDSIDSTSFARNESWSILDDYRNKTSLFPVPQVPKEAV